LKVVLEKIKSPGRFRGTGDAPGNFSMAKLVERGLKKYEGGGLKEDRGGASRNKWGCHQAPCGNLGNTGGQDELAAGLEEAGESLSAFWGGKGRRALQRNFRR